MGPNSNALIILAKHPKPSRSKTRLIPSLGAITASHISELFLVDLLRRFVVTEIRIVVAGSKNDTEEEFRDLFGKYGIQQDRIEIFLPRTDSMIDDIAKAYSFVLEKSKKAVLTAIDIPYLSTSMINGMFRYLDDRDLVFYPNFDGTACPQGMKKFHDLFSGLPATLLDQWLPRIKSLKLSYKMLEPIFDIDKFADLEMFYCWQLFLEDSGDLEMFCPETIQLLKSLLGKQDLRPLTGS